MIRTSVLSKDPSKCKETATRAFLTQTTEKTGKAAVKACEEEAKDTSDNPNSLTVSKVVVNGSKARADVAFVGGGFDAQTVAVALVKEGDQWKLDQLTGFANFDKTALAKSFEERLEEGGQLTAEQTSCIVGKFERESQQEIEELVLGGSASEFEELAESCA